jgi:hypothetical protein
MNGAESERLEDEQIGSQISSDDDDLVSLFS